MNKDVAKINYFHDRISQIAYKAINELDKKRNHKRHSDTVDRETLNAVIRGEVKLTKITTKNIIDYLAKHLDMVSSYSLIESFADKNSIKIFNLKDDDRKTRVNNIIDQTKIYIKDLITTNMDYAYLQDNQNLLTTLQTFEEIVNDKVRIALQEVKGIEEQGG